MDASEEQLVRGAVAGDSAALSELLRRHGPAVERALRIEQTWQSVLEPADVMQVTYLEAFLRIQHFDLNGGASFATWLRHVAENNLKDAIRGLTRQKRPQPQQRVRPPTYEDSMVGLYDLLGATHTTPSRQVGRMEACKLLESAMASLPEDYGLVIRLYDIEGQPIAEVAKSLGRSAGAVHMLRARAHDRLRDALGSSSAFFDSSGA